MANRETLKVEINVNELKKYLEKYGITRKEFASVIGIDERTLSRWIMIKEFPLDALFIFINEYWPRHNEIKALVNNYVWYCVLSEYISVTYHNGGKETIYSKRNEMERRSYMAEIPEHYNFDIRELSLSIRALNGLKRGGIEKTSQFNGITINNLLKIRGIGDMTAKEIIEKVVAIGFNLEHNVDHTIKEFNHEESLEKYYPYHFRWKGVNK